MITGWSVFLKLFSEISPGISIIVLLKQIQDFFFKIVVVIISTNYKLLNYYIPVISLFSFGSYVPVLQSHWSLTFWSLYLCFSIIIFFSELSSGSCWVWGFWGGCFVVWVFFETSKNCSETVCFILWGKLVGGAVWAFSQTAPSVWRLKIFRFHFLHVRRSPKASLGQM